MKYGMWLDEWFRNYIQPSSKIKTCERYSEIIEKHLKVKLGEYELDELTPLVLQRYVTELLRSGNIVTGKDLAANSVNGITVRSYQRTFELLQKRLHIERKGFHSLRHTFATRALECGMDVKTLAEILGHKNATVTLNRYAHSLMEHKQDMMNKLGKIFN